MQLNLYSLTGLISHLSLFITNATDDELVFLRIHTLAKKKVEWIRRIPFHRVAALGAFGIEELDPFRDCIDSLLIDLEGLVPFDDKQGY